jgi:Spy/CpxP family protein refolding chaperone
MLAAAMFAMALQAPVSGQALRWWNDPEVRRELELTEAQANRINAIFQAALPQLRANRRALDREQATFDRLLAEGREEEAVAQIDVLAAAEMRRNVDRARMLLRMAEALTPQQRRRLEALNRVGERRRR